MAKTAENSIPSLKIRPFPFPYKAGFALCNDLDGILNFREMKAIHDVLNGRKDTPSGPGLGLEIGDSFHFYTTHPEQDDTWSYFNSTTAKPSKDASQMREGIASGLLDTIHTWGNFSQKGGFFRKHAERALEELDRYGLKIPVWTNHGDLHNFQNLGRKDSLGDVKEQVSVRGDRSQVLEYHLDLTQKAGVRYVWIKELTEIVGQERALEPSDWIEEGVNLGRDVIKSFIERGLSKKAKSPPQVGNALLKPNEFRDNSVLYGMLRYGSFSRDGADNLPELLTESVLKKLVGAGGALMLYIHLGKGRKSQEEPFTRDSFRALYNLADYAHRGDIWVTTASRLCNYIELRQRLTLKIENLESDSVINLDCTPMGNLEPPDLSGFTFYSSKDVQKVIMNGNEVAVKPNPKDHTGQLSYSIPLETIEYCWD